MLKSLKNTKAQAMMGEYAVVIALAMAVLMTMGVFVRRAIQARIHDARDYMVSEVRNRTLGLFNGNLYKEYEPYYINTAAEVTRSHTDTSGLLPGGSSGIFLKTFDETTSATISSETAPPKDFNLTTPIN
jgi:hypothetical protein